MLEVRMEPCMVINFYLLCKIRHFHLTGERYDVVYGAISCCSLLEMPSAAGSKFMCMWWRIQSVSPSINTMGATVFGFRIFKFRQKKTDTKKHHCSPLIHTSSETERSQSTRLHNNKQQATTININIIKITACGFVPWMGPCWRFKKLTAAAAGAAAQREAAAVAVNPCLFAAHVRILVPLYVPAAFKHRPNANKWMIFWEERPLGSMSIVPWPRVRIAITRKPIFYKCKFDRPMNPWVFFTSAVNAVISGMTSSRSSRKNEKRDGRTLAIV